MTTDRTRDLNNERAINGCCLEGADRCRLHPEHFAYEGQRIIHLAICSLCECGELKIPSPQCGVATASEITTPQRRAPAKV